MELSPLEGVAAVILAGGQGTRLFPLTQSRCKPAVGFGGRYRLIDIPLSNAINSRIEHLFVISQYFASDLHHHILSTYRLDLFQTGSFKLLSPEEHPGRKEWFAGTADAVRKNLDHLLKVPADYFLILSGDQLYNIDFKEMISFARDRNADVVIAALPVAEEEARRMGLLKIDRSHLIRQFVEKPQVREVLDRFGIYEEKKRYLGSMGIYVFKREALISLLSEEGDDFGHHLLPQQVAKGKTYAFVYGGYWVDIGTIASFYDANLALLERKFCLDTYDESHPIYTSVQNLPSPILKHTLVKDSLLGQGSIIEAQEIIKSVIGIRSHIKQGTRLTHSIVMGNPPCHASLSPDFSIGKECLIEKSIIDEQTQLGDGVQLINRDKRHTFDGEGVYIRDGIIIVTAGTKLPDGFIL